MIDRFDGEYRWLSNFWSVPVVFEGATYPSVEHAYQAAKTTDHKAREPFQQPCYAGIAKRMGRRVKLRSDWESVKLLIMEKLLVQKFQQDDLRQKLIDTGDAELVEGNTWGDTFWGVCRGHGMNHLGILLMEVRRRCRLIPEHLGGGSKLPEPLPKRPAEDRTCPGIVYFIAKMKGDRIEMYDWMPKTDPLPVLQEHVQRLQIAAPKGQRFMLIGYVMSEAYEAR